MTVASYMKSFNAKSYPTFVRIHRIRTRVSMRQELPGVDINDHRGFGIMVFLSW
jgi:hypothetical protein